MSRSIWKGPYVHPITKKKIIEKGWTMNQLTDKGNDLSLSAFGCSEEHKIMSQKKSDVKKSEDLTVIQKNIQSRELTKIEIMKLYGIEIKDRNTTILPEFIDKIVKIHKGNGYVAIEIKKEHVGLKLGNLVRTKKIPEYKKKKK